MQSLLRFGLLVWMLGTCAGFCEAAEKPLKVYILAGQSNMQGHARIDTFDSLADDPKTAPLLKEMRGADGKPVVCQKVWISSVGCMGDAYTDLREKKGLLTAGFGAPENKIGPEFTFGITLEKALNEPILIIKTSWGGRSLHTDFRPPSAGPYPWSEYELAQRKKRGDDPEKFKAEKLKETGFYYQKMIDHVKFVLNDIKRVVPDYDPKQGYELAGFVWFQGFNDVVADWTYDQRMKPGGYGAYGELLCHLIRDVRKDLGAAKMPFVIGVMGIGGEKEGRKPPHKHFREAQVLPLAKEEFKGNVFAVHTSAFWDDELDALAQRMEKVNNKLNQEAKKEPKPTKAERDTAKSKAIAEAFTPEELKKWKGGVSNGGYHYLGAAKIMAPIGKAFAEALLPQTKREAEPKNDVFEIQQILSMPTEKPNDFRHAVLAASSEQRVVMSRNLIITDRDDPQATTSRFHMRTWKDGYTTRTKLGDATVFGFVPQSHMAYTVNWGEGVILWDTRIQTKIGAPYPHEFREDTMPHPAFSPDGEILVTRSQLKSIQFWDVKRQRQITDAMEQKGIVSKLEFSSDGKWLFCHNNPDEISVWNGRTGKQVAGPLQNQLAGYPAAYHPTTQKLVTVENTKSQDAEQSELSIRSGKDWEKTERVRTDMRVNSVKWLNETHLLLTGTRSQEPNELPRKPFFGSDMIEILKWNGMRYETAASLRSPQRIVNLQVAPDGKHFITKSANSPAIQCFAVGEMKTLWTIPRGGQIHTSEANWVAITTDNDVVIHSLSDGKELWRERGVESVQVHGSDLWTYGKEAVKLWRVKSQAR